MIDALNEFIAASGLDPRWDSIAKLIYALDDKGQDRLADEIRFYLYQHEGITLSIFIAPFMERYTTYLRERERDAALRQRRTASSNGGRVAGPKKR